VTNGIPHGCLLLLPVGTVNCVQTLKADIAGAVGYEVEVTCPSIKGTTLFRSVDVGLVRCSVLVRIVVLEDDFGCPSLTNCHHGFCSNAAGSAD
jgi:hypothetical protein